MTTARSRQHANLSVPLLVFNLCDERTTSEQYDLKLKLKKTLTAASINALEFFLRPANRISDSTVDNCVAAMSSLKQPISQVRLTNVAIVRMKRRGKRFEIACYKNKVVSWREGNEGDIDEVLQTDQIFTNVSKGILANKKDLQAAFKMDDMSKILLEILKNGELQVSEKERQHQAGNVFNEIAVIVANSCVDPATKRPFSVGIIERAMRDTLHFAVVPSRSAKVQAQAVIKQLGEHMSISRAQMRLRISVPNSVARATKEKLKDDVQKWEEEDWDGVFQATVLIDPGSFRAVDEILRNESRGRASFEVVSLAVVEEREEALN
jgi:ribosome maturation protein SDO1